MQGVRPIHFPDTHVTGFIDPVEFPFTEDEVRRAGVLHTTLEAADSMAAQLARCGPPHIEAHEGLRARIRQSGIAGADAAIPGGWVFPDHLIPALTALGGETEVRARAFAEAGWESVYRGALQRAVDGSLRARGLLPGLDELLALQKARKHDAGNGGLVLQLQITPEDQVPTVAMQVAAAALVRGYGEHFESRVRALRAGKDGRAERVNSRDDR
jgi:hypothetical protein